jgi:hypothetical protein
MMFLNDLKKNVNNKNSYDAISILCSLTSVLNARKPNRYIPPHPDDPNPWVKITYTMCKFVHKRAKTGSGTVRAQTNADFRKNNISISE